MAKGSMTIAEVKKAKADLELEILKMVKAFEKDSGTKVNYLNFKRDYPEEEYPEPIQTKDYPIKDVEISLDLDLVY
jgi:hypothetical protein